MDWTVGGRAHAENEGKPIWASPHGPRRHRSRSTMASATVGRWSRYTASWTREHNTGTAYKCRRAGHRGTAPAVQCQNAWNYTYHRHSTVTAVQREKNVRSAMILPFFPLHHTTLMHENTRKKAVRSLSRLSFYFSIHSCQICSGDRHPFKRLSFVLCIDPARAGRQSREPTKGYFTLFSWERRD